MRLGWLRPPRYADEGATRIARVVHYVGLAIMAGVLPAIVHNYAAGRPVAVVVLLAEELLAFFCLLLNRRGAGHLAAHLLAVSAIGLAATLQAVGGQRGVHDVAVLIYPCTILVSGALFERRWFIFYTALAMLALACQYTSELTGLLTYELSRYAELALLVDAEIILLVSALAAGLLVGNLRQSVATSQATAASLRDSEQLYRSLFESVNEAILVYDPKTAAIVDTNQRANELFGYTAQEMSRLTATDLSSNTSGYDREAALKRMAITLQGQPQLFEWHVRARDGRVFWAEVSTHMATVGGQPRLLASLRDIDERKQAEVERRRLEEQLRQAGKLESLGRLAGGIAHDFNNLLTCVLGNVDLGMTVISPSHPIRENLEEIRHAARRAAELTSQLLAYSRKQPISPVSLDLARVLDSVDRMLRRLLGETVMLKTEVAADVGRIRADPGQIEQILVNLAVNARDAMPGGGRLHIAAANEELDEIFCAAHPAARVGAFVRISVADTGIGMSEEVQQHIFEPFFTTKPMGKGTGLGLAMVFGAMEQNRGFILLRSRPGQGSTFQLYFPRSTSEAESAIATTKLPALPMGKERVLLVEDDAAVQLLSARLLGRLGYQVTVCSSGREAIATCGADSTPFDLLLTDLILPDMDGRALAKRLEQERPGMRVLYCSGYSEDVIAHQGVLDPGLAFLAKPFTSEAMARKVREVLDEPQAAAKAE